MIATYEPTITTAGGLGSVRLGGPKGPSWGASAGMWDRDEMQPSEVAHQLAADINAAHEAAMVKVRGQLSVMRAAMFELSRRSHCPDLFAYA